MRPVTRLATLLFATAALAACDDKPDIFNVVTPITPIATIAGTFSLQTLNGLGLPQTIVDNGVTVSLTASTLTLVTTNTTSGSFTLTVTTQVDAETPVTDTTTGTYTLSGTALSLVSDGTTLTGSWDGANAITLTEFGSTAVYTRP